MKGRYFRSDESLPLRQKVLVRRGDNGQIVVVKRTMFGKVRISYVPLQRFPVSISGAA